MVTTHLYNTDFNPQFWQIELESNPISGNTVDWGERVRLRHVTTKRYLAATTMCVRSSYIIPTDMYAMYVVDTTQGRSV